MGLVASVGWFVGGAGYQCCLWWGWFASVDLFWVGLAVLFVGGAGCKFWLFVGGAGCKCWLFVGGAGCKCWLLV